MRRYNTLSIISILLFIVGTVILITSNQMYKEEIKELHTKTYILRDSIKAKEARLEKNEKRRLQSETLRLIAKKQADSLKLVVTKKEKELKNIKGQFAKLDNTEVEQLINNKYFEENNSLDTTKGQILLERPVVDFSLEKIATVDSLEEIILYKNAIIDADVKQIELAEITITTYVKDQEEYMGIIEDKNEIIDVKEQEIKTVKKIGRNKIGKIITIGGVVIGVETLLLILLL